MRTIPWLALLAVAIIGGLIWLLVWALTTVGNNASLCESAGGKLVIAKNGSHCLTQEVFVQGWKDPDFYMNGE